MNTPAHFLISGAAFMQPERKARNWACFLGALAPDLMMFVMVGWMGFVRGRTPEQIFSEDYFSDFWQGIFAVTNSVPVFLLIALMGWALMRGGSRVSGDAVMVFGFSGAIASFLDLPVHHDDGHPHFWPFTDWIYESPVSYWDPRHHGLIAGPLEFALSLVLAIILWRRFKGRFARGLILFTLAIEAFFALTPFFFL